MLKSKHIHQLILFVAQSVGYSFSHVKKIYYRCRKSEYMQYALIKKSS